VRIVESAVRIGIHPLSNFNLKYILIERNFKTWYLIVRYNTIFQEKNVLLGHLPEMDVLMESTNAHTVILRFSKLRLKCTHNALTLTVQTSL
jgi:hypothetical protein